MNTPKTTPYLVSDRAFRIIMTEVIERLCLECVDADCFHAVIHLVRNYLQTGELTTDAIRLTPPEGYRIFLMYFQHMIDSSIRRSRSARAAAARRKEERERNPDAYPRSNRRPDNGRPDNRPRDGYRDTARSSSRRDYGPEDENPEGETLAQGLIRIFGL